MLTTDPTIFVTKIINLSAPKRWELVMKCHQSKKVCYQHQKVVSKINLTSD